MNVRQLRMRRLWPANGRYVGGSCQAVRAHVNASYSTLAATAASSDTATNLTLELRPGTAMTISDMPLMYCF